MDLIRELATREPRTGGLSMDLSRGPSVRANTAGTAGWLIGLRNGLRETARAADKDGRRDERLASCHLRERVADNALGLSRSSAGISSSRLAHRPLRR
jgi:hypothetical protein